jgi:hypothetical protein
MYSRRYLAREGIRSAAYTVALALLVWVIGAVTDEGNLSVSMRIARVLPLLGLACGLGSLWASLRARNNGEVRALAALSGDPRMLQTAWMAGSTAIGILGVILLFAGVSTEGFLPAPPQAAAFEWVNDSNGSDAYSGEFRSQAFKVSVRKGELRALAEAVPVVPAAATSRMAARDLPLVFALGGFLLVSCAGFAWLGARAPIGSGSGAHRMRRNAVLAFGITALSVIVLLCTAAGRLPAVASVSALAALCAVVCLRFA